MPITNPPSVVSFDAEGMLQVAQDTVDGTLRSVVEYDMDAFNPLYVDDVTLAFYQDEDHMMDHFERIHDYVHLDFHAMNLYTDSLFPPADRVRFIATGFDFFTLLRVYNGDEGIFLALDSDEQISPLVSRIEEAFWREHSGGSENAAEVG